jgi:serine protease Do
LELDDRSTASVAGGPVVLIGYPTGIEGILARAGDDTTEKVTENAQLVSRLATQRLIRPTTTRGHIGDVLKDKIVYDAATTSGGSNLAVPIRYADKLVK